MNTDANLSEISDKSGIEKAIHEFDRHIKGDNDLRQVQTDANVQQIRQMIESEFQKLKKSRTSKIWIQYIEMLDVLRKFVKAERTGNWLLHLQAVADMLPYFAASGHNAYTKSSYIYLSNMSNLKISNPYLYDHFMHGYHCVRRSD